MANEIAFAKRTFRTFRTLVRSVALLALYAGGAGSAQAAVKSESHAISSASVNIRVSVATRYKVQFTALTAVNSFGAGAASNGLCIVSNTAPMALPTMVMSDAGVTTIDRCGSPNKPQVGDPKPFTAPVSGLVLIRPE
jgi:hypothetical protein